MIWLNCTLYRIWEHLIEIVSGGKTTIIITTHYVEEARQANMVGLMRNGKILAESNPDLLLERYQLPVSVQIKQMQ